MTTNDCGECKRVQVTGLKYCSQLCAYWQGGITERERILDLIGEYEDVIDCDDGTVRPNQAMRIALEIRGEDR